MVGTQAVSSLFFEINRSDVRADICADVRLIHFIKKLYNDSTPKAEFIW